MTAVCLAGLLAGSLHVFSGADHLAALAPLSLHARRRAWTLGLRWGLGHSGGVLLVAAAAFGLRRLGTFDALSGWSDRLAGVSLILLGLWGFRGLFRRRLHAHAHPHDGEEHVHFHVHAPQEDHAAPEAHVHTHAAFGVGLLHGLGGSAHLLGILPGLALVRGLETGAYLGCFAAGSVASMTLYAALIGALADRGLRTYRWMLGTASGACALTGLVWLFPGVLPC